MAGHLGLAYKLHSSLSYLLRLYRYALLVAHMDNTEQATNIAHFLEEVVVMAMERGCQVGFGDASTLC